MNTDIKKIRNIIENCYLYIPFNSEALRINYCDEDRFYTTGEESGDEITVEYDEVDLEKDMFYELKLMDM